MKRHLILLASLLSVGLCVTTQTSCSDDDKNENSSNDTQDTTSNGQNNSQDGFIGDSISGYINKTPYVDLGLSVKWCCYNVNASRMTQLGNYYGWGEVSASGSYTFNDYKYKTFNSYTMSKYCTDERYGDIDNLTVLQPTDDASSMAMGMEWRMPTAEEMRELISNCSWQYVEGYQNNLNKGYLGTSKKNGNTIFFAETSYKDGNSVRDYAGKSLYWSSSLSEFSNSGAALVFAKKMEPEVSHVDRYIGLQIRPVVK